jgi:hypothetical protein
VGVAKRNHSILHTRGVDPNLGAAGLAVVTAVGTTLWNTGGRAAVERRAIQQELQIASEMPDGLARRQLRVATEHRVAMYVFRRLGPGRGPGFHLIMLAAVIIAYGVVSGLGQLVDLGPAWLEFVTRTAFLSAVVLLGLVAALWASESWRDHMAGERRDNLAAAMRRLRQLDADDSIALDESPQED